MNIVQCQFCKKPFASLGGRICPACMEQIDRDFITVRDYIYEHSHAGIDEVSEETDVPKQIIIYLLKEGRLTIGGPDGSGGGVLMCEACKKPINSGRLCETCKKKLSATIDNKGSSGKPQGSGGDSSGGLKNPDLKIR